MSTRPPIPTPATTPGLRLAQALVRIRSDVSLLVLDGVLLVAAYTGVLHLRFDGSVPVGFASTWLLFVAVALCIHLPINWAWGLYGQMWRHASVQEARRVVLAGITSTVALAATITVGSRLIPLSVLLLGGALATMATGALRFHARLFAFERDTGRRAGRVLVLGAGESGAAIVRDMLRSPGAGLSPVAILDDDPRKWTRVLQGVRVVGGLADLASAASRFGADQVLLAIPSASGELVRAVARQADDAGIPLKILPGVSELVSGDVGVRDVRDLEITDLLGRAQITTDLDAVERLLRDRRVLITGAGGSIGSELVRQIAACQPGALVLLDHDESHLYDASAAIGDRCTQVLADIRDGRLVEDVFRRHRPEIVFHAAAHKHVPMLEAHPCEAVATNVVGTANVVAAARANGVSRFVLISTDKAVRPSSVMGATKRMAEELTLSLAPSGTRYCAVRFGNVLGSRGSVVPRFMAQIERGGPVTITDPRMTRYFMSIPEAVQLVLQAAVFAEGGEVFMLDMGAPVRIIDLAERLIRLSGRRVGTDVAIRVTGPRPGEKLTEELHAPEETIVPTAHPSIASVQPVTPEPSLLAARLRRLTAAVQDRDDLAARLVVFGGTAGSADVRIPSEAPLDFIIPEALSGSR